MNGLAEGHQMTFTRRVLYPRPYVFISETFCAMDAMAPRIDRHHALQALRDARSDPKVVALASSTAKIPIEEVSNSVPWQSPHGSLPSSPFL